MKTKNKHQKRLSLKKIKEFMFRREKIFRNIIKAVCLMNIHEISLSKVNRKLIMNKEEQTSRQVFSLCFWCCCFFYALKLIRSVGKAIGSRLYFEEPNKKQNEVS